MKIMIITASFPFGPGEAFLVPELRELSRLGHELLLVPFFPRGPIIHEEAHGFLQSTIVAGPASPRIIASLPRLLRDTKSCGSILASWMKTERPAQLWKEIGILPKGIWAGRIAGGWGADHIHAYWATAPASVAMIAAEISQRPWSLTAHRYDLVQNGLLKEKVRRAKFIRFISHLSLEMSGLAEEELLDKALVLHLGVDVAEWQSRTPIPDADKPVVFSPANLIRVKGHEYLIDAVAALRDRGTYIELCLAGDGYLREALEKQVTRLRLSDRVHFLGQLPHGRVVDSYRAGRFGIVVLPSVDCGNGEHEGLPISLVEAMAFGVPTISTATGGIPELLGGGAGFLVQPGNANALADAIQMLIENPELRQSLGLAGRRKVEREFAVAGIVRQLTSLFAGSPAEAVSTKSAANAGSTK